MGSVFQYHTPSGLCEGSRPHHQSTYLNKSGRESGVLGGEEAVCVTDVTGTSGTSNTVDVVLELCWWIGGWVINKEKSVDKLLE